MSKFKSPSFLLCTLSTRSSSNALVLCRLTEFEIAQTGSVTLNLEGAESAKVWIDNKVVENTGKITRELEAGKHSLVLRFDPKALPEKVKASASTGTFLVD